MTHGLRDTRIYGIWHGMLQRCYNPSRPKYKDYGGRGIGVCDEWRHDVKAFYEWAMSHGYADDLTIDRIDVNGNYEPSNCRWITIAEQSYNKSTSRLVTYKGETKTIAEWAKIKNIKTVTLWSRIVKSKWDIEKAIETPVSSAENCKRAIVQYSKQGDFIREWNGAIDAARELQISHANINLCCMMKRQSAGGYIWRYREE